MITATKEVYKRIEGILAKLDQVPEQIMLEAVIAEVTLNDSLKLGTRWYFSHGNNTASLTDLATGAVGSRFPGFSWSFATNNVQVTLNALSEITDVKVISSPTLMALNNQKATLQVGDQVPVVTQQSSSTLTSSSQVINSIEMKDTGVILSVVPRVNASGRVMLDVAQEVSSVVKTTTSGIDSPTIQQRRISTRVVVADGESLALGGLIQERNTLTRTQVPLLGDIPVLGNAFKDKTDGVARTELMIFISPHVVRNVADAREVTAEYRVRLDRPHPLDRRNGETREMGTVKRLAY